MNLYDEGKMLRLTLDSIPSCADQLTSEAGLSHLSLLRLL